MDRALSSGTVSVVSRFAQAGSMAHQSSIIDLLGPIEFDYNRSQWLGCLLSVPSQHAPRLWLYIQLWFSAHPVRFFCLICKRWMFAQNVQRRSIHKDYANLFHVPVNVISLVVEINLPCSLFSLSRERVSTVLSINKTNTLFFVIDNAKYKKSSFQEN